MGDRRRGRVAALLDEPAYHLRLQPSRHRAPLAEWVAPEAAPVTDETALEQAWTSFGGDPLSPTHGWQKTRCVLHSERRASATVNVEAGKWSCFAGCGRGDVYDLIGLHEGLPEFLDQKAYADERGWIPEGEAQPEPSLMNPRPRSKKSKGKQPWKPSWT